MSFIKLLSDDDIDCLKRKYVVDIKDDYLTIKASSINRLTYHNLNDKIRVKVNGRSLLITPNTITFWKNNFKDYSIFEVQNVINTLQVLYQEVTLENVDNLLKRKHSKIITI